MIGKPRPLSEGDIQAYLAVAAALAEKPELSTTAVLMIAIPETVVIQGFVVAAAILFR